MQDLNKYIIYETEEEKSIRGGRKGREIKIKIKKKRKKKKKKKSVTFTFSSPPTKTPSPHAVPNIAVDGQQRTTPNCLTCVRCPGRWRCVEAITEVFVAMWGRRADKETPQKLAGAYPFIRTLRPKKHHKSAKQISLQLPYHIISSVLPHALPH
jgi:hypothetical protein